MKRIRLIIVIGILLFVTPAMRAQDFLQKAKSYLDAGECEKAQNAYKAYRVANPSNAEVERRIDECWKRQGSSQTTTTKPPTVQKPVDGQPCPGAATGTDIDGNTYNTVQIGKQCWMRENLRTTRYADGTTILMDSKESKTIAYRYAPDYQISNVTKYGYLYNWSAVMHGARGSKTNPSGVQGICPNGWHVPSDAEWTELTDYVSSRSEYLCGNDKENIAKALASTEGWKNNDGNCDVGNNPSANNATGFSILPAGGYYGSYYIDDFRHAVIDDFGYVAIFWSATEDNGSPAYVRSFHNYYTDVSRYVHFNTEFGFSVRCVRD